MIKPLSPPDSEAPDPQQNLLRLKLRLEVLLNRAEAQGTKDHSALALQVADLIEDMTDELLQFYQAARLTDTPRADVQIVIQAYERVRDVLRRWRSRPTTLHKTLVRALERASKQDP